MDSDELEYAGFWIRLWASLIDTVLVLMVTTPLLVAVYGWHDTMVSSGAGFRPFEFSITWILPAIAVIAFWRARLGQAPSTGQLIGRYVGYYVSTIPFGLGLLWVAFDPRKQGWHDKLAGTVVVRRKSRGTEPVRFGP